MHGVTRNTISVLTVGGVLTRDHVVWGSPGSWGVGRGWFYTGKRGVFGGSRGVVSPLNNVFFGEFLVKPLLDPLPPPRTPKMTLFDPKTPNPDVFPPKNHPFPPKTLAKVVSRGECAGCARVCVCRGVSRCHAPTSPNPLTPSQTIPTTQ